MEATVSVRTGALGAAIDLRERDPSEVEDDVPF